MQKFKELCKNINYQFKDVLLLELALTHRSHAMANNERLEFIGDAIVNFVIAEEIYNKFPMAQEGELSILRSSLINRNTLAELAMELNLGAFLILGQGEVKTGGRERHSILSCAMEAIIGAIYFDAGFKTCQKCILAWYRARLDNLSLTDIVRDAKSTLQEYLQAHKHELPIYTIVNVEGLAHEQMFTVECKITGIKHKTTAEASSRRKAEQEAAMKFLTYLQQGQT